MTYSNKGSAIQTVPRVISALKRLPQIEDATFRACYLCGPIAGCAGIYYSETLYPTLLECTHPRMCALREKLKADISSLDWIAICYNDMLEILRV